MRTLFIPPLGTEIVLAEPWTFDLFRENFDLFEALDIEVLAYGCISAPVTLPAGTALKLDRIYIRKGKKDFDSVTFIATLPGYVRGKRPRFWAKLCDVNRIMCE